MGSSVTCVCGQEFTGDEAAEVRMSGTCHACGSDTFYRKVESHKYQITMADQVRTDIVEGWRDPKPEEVGTTLRKGIEIRTPNRKFPEGGRKRR